MLWWQVAFIAVHACVHCGPESGDNSVKALVATLRKRLSAARESLPPCVRNVQVQGNIAIARGYCARPDWLNAQISTDLACMFYYLA